MLDALPPLDIGAVLSPKSRWRVAEIEDFIGAAQLPLRVSSISEEGFPHIASLWFHYDGGRFFCCTQRSAQVSLHLRHNARVGFELAVNSPPYRGLSGVGTARVLEGDAGALLETLTARYLDGRDRKLKGWLMSRLATEVIIAITPQRLTSWDFSRRMTAPDKV
jgi:hypothetical protein